MCTQDENDEVEFKEHWRTESIVRTMIAFANGWGGIIFVGVNNDGEVTGLEPMDRIKDTVSNLVSNNCSPPIRTRSRVIKFQDTYIVAIGVYEGELHSSKDGRYYIRRGASNRPMLSAEVKALAKADSKRSPKFGIPSQVL